MCYQLHGCVFPMVEILHRIQQNDADISAAILQPSSEHTQHNKTAA